MSVPPSLTPMDPTDLSQSPYYPPMASDAAAGLPINLDSLRDGPPGSKPFYPYSTLIRYAIKGSPNQKLLLEDIYYAIESRFPYFRAAPSGWKNSVRHNLSLNPCFVKVARPLTDRGKGSYWTVDDNVDPRTGVHRVRKRRSAKAAQSQSTPQAQNDDPDAAYEPPGGNHDVEPFGPERYAGPEVAGASRAAYPYPGYDGSGYAMAQAGHVRFGIDEGEDEGYMPEADEHNQPIWRNMWVNELLRLKTWTSEQEKAGADPDWFRMMFLRVRSVLHPMLADGQPGMVMPHGAGMPEDHEQT